MMLMAKKAIFLTCSFTLALFLFSCQTSPSAPSPTAYDYNYSGTYRHMNGDDFSEDGGCLLKVIHQIAMEVFDHIDFELSCNKGAPSYNMGYAADTILFENSSSKMAVWSSPYGDCHLVFEFSSSDVVISQIGYAPDCGFGGNVYASGEYQLEDNSIPQLGCLAMSSSCE